MHYYFLYWFESFVGLVGLQCNSLFFSFFQRNEESGFKWRFYDYLIFLSKLVNFGILNLNIVENIFAMWKDKIVLNVDLYYSFLNG